ncbi:MULTISPECIES: DUF3592 domain-containing protein [Pseudofrankia]|uniref:DUF3592 domain-containing protein n=1 Tax=Pseudofrankia TaxID=2994363 RepID=UPI000234D5A7|nr:MULTISPECIES: DUF3592 domain-containing protein [Pseudofrankia]OHV31900.1 DUF3592 domain-containing protein [Pseudofrankia sp. EUN1h]
MSVGTIATLATISMVFAGALFLSLGLFTLRQILQRLWLRFAGHTALATIVDFEVIERDSDDGGSIYTPIVDYTTRAGEQVRAAALRSPDTSFPGIGAKVRVVYRPGDPTWVTRTDWFGAVLSAMFLLPVYFTAGPFCLYFGIRMLTD